MEILLGPNLEMDLESGNVSWKRHNCCPTSSCFTT